MTRCLYISIFHDINYLEHIIYHCNRLEQICNMFGDSIEKLDANINYKELTVFNITQICENINCLSEDFKQIHDTISWNEIKKVMNYIVHRYKLGTSELLYSIITSLVPKIKVYCQGQLDKILAQQASKVTGPKPPRP